MYTHLIIEQRNRQSTVIVGDFNTPHYEINRTTKILKVREDFNYTIKHIYQIYIYGIVHPSI